MVFYFAEDEDFRQELQRVIVFRSCSERIRPGGQHFQHVL